MNKTSYKHMLYKLTIALLLVLGLEVATVAQQQKNMALDEAIEQMLQNNWQIRKGEKQLEIAADNVKTTSSIYLPSINLSETFINTNDPMMAFGTKLQQSSITSQDFDPNLLNYPNSISNFNTRIEATQPLFNLDGIHGRNSAIAASQAQGKHHEWTKEMMILKTKELYFNLIIAREAQEVLKQAEKTATKSYNTSQDLFDQGMINKADLMGVELSLTQVKSQLLHMNHFSEELNQNFLQLIGSADNFVISPTDSLQSYKIDLDALSSLLLPEDRSDLQALALTAKAEEFNLKSQKSGFTPRVNAFGSYSLNDTRILGNKSDNYLVGLQMKWDVFQGNKRIGKVQKAKHQTDLAYISYEEKKSEASRNIKKLKNSMVLATKQIELAELALNQAQAVYDIRANRYAEGLEKTTEVLADESNLLSKQLDLLKILNEYAQLIFLLEMKSGQKLTKEN